MEWTIDVLFTVIRHTITCDVKVYYVIE